MDKAFDAILILAGFELATTEIVSVERSYDEIRIRVEEAQVLAAKTIFSLASNCKVLKNIVSTCVLNDNTSFHSSDFFPSYKPSSND